MARQSELVERMKAVGWRLTPQRLLILQALAGAKGHTSVDQIFASAQKAYPYMDVTTVYRTLQLLKKMGVVTEAYLGDKLHFEVVSPGDHHHHMVCSRCGKTFDLPSSYLESFRESLVIGLDFEPDLTHFIVPGACAECRKQERKAS